MAQKDIEIILTRQLASYLAMPIFIVDVNGTLLYYNERAEQILGQRFDETGEMPAEVWGTIFQPFDDEGGIIPAMELPLARVITEKHPAHSTFSIKAFDGLQKRIEVTAFPLIGTEGTLLGGMAIFWETPDQ
jgi:PAS domain-containing protein